MTTLASLLRLVVPLCLASFWTGPALAQTASHDPVAAEVVFERALEALREGDWATACPAFQKSMKLDPSASTMAKIARCHEHDGQLATAWYDYQQALKLVAEGDYLEKRRAELETFVQNAADELEARVPRLRILVSPAVADLEVVRDGQQVPVAALGEALFVDPGTHEIVARAPGYEDARARATVVEGEATTVELALVPKPASPVVTTRPLALQPVSTPAADPAQHPTAASPRREWTRRHTGGVLGGAGVVSLAVGTYFWVETREQVDQADETCDESWACDAAGQANLNQARSAQTAAIVLTASGGILVGTGVSLWLLPAPSKSQPRRAQVHVLVHPAGVSLRGRW